MDSLNNISDAIKKTSLGAEELLSLCESEYDSIEEEAKRISLEFLEWLELENNKRKIGDKSVLRVRVRRRGRFVLNITWQYTRFYKNRNGWVPRSADISKGRSSVYPRDRLAKRALGWELDEVMRCEHQFGQLRSRQKQLGTMVRYLTSFIRQSKKQ